MDQFPTPARHTIKTILVTVLLCSFIPGLHRIGPFLLHTTAHRLEQTARVADHLSGYERPAPEYEYGDGR